jgi:SAM-dependent methyltransferase
LSAEEIDAPEPTYPLHLRLCGECLLLQIPALITPEDTFTEYAYFSSFADSWVQHAKSFVDEAAARLDLGRDSFVVEVASNDGYLLQHVVAAGIPCLGIEPSQNVGAAARDRGVPTRTDFLGEDVARAVTAEHGPADLVVANNVYAHVPDIVGFGKALRTLLADDGWLSIEVHHALNLVTLGQFDTVYHEHFQYYTVLSATRALAAAGLSVVDAELISTHGGSIRLWARPDSLGAEPTSRFFDIMAMEKRSGLHDVTGYLGLRSRTEALRHELLRFLLECKAANRRVVGYGAPGKGNTLLNYCGIRSDLLEYTVDRNPYKHGRYTPGTRIPILEPEAIAQDRPDVVLVLPWNLETEITQQLSYVADWGGELVYPLPSLHTVSRKPEVVGSQAR